MRGKRRAVKLKVLSKVEKSEVGETIFVEVDASEARFGTLGFVTNEIWNRRGWRGYRRR